ncbi:MAG: sigma-70 family RNA polymerase sigma factor [Bacteroidota bacterium]
MSAQRFHEQVWPLRDRLYRLALRLVGEGAEAEDVVQETMIKIWEKRTDLDEIHNLEGWCMRLVRNLGIDKLRSRQRKGLTSLDQAALMQENGAGPARQLEGKDAMEQLQKMLQNLPEQRRLVVQLREIEGLSYKEIAAALDISVDQVKTDIHRGRQQLRRTLTQQGYHA